METSTTNSDKKDKMEGSGFTDLPKKPSPSVHRGNTFHLYNLMSISQQTDDAEASSTVHKDSQSLLTERNRNQGLAETDRSKRARTCP